MRTPRLIQLAAALLLIAGCDDSEEDVALPARPVLSVVVAASHDAQIGFAGTIQPRYETDLGFQVGGNVTSFDVEVGDVVAEGQTLALLDPIQFEAQSRSREADLAKAESQFANAAASQLRTDTLLAKDVTSQADSDAAQEARATAEASVRAAEANLAKARDELGYTTLASDMAGVVTEKTGEVGQTVSAGQKVLTLARLDVREAVVDLPEAVQRSIAEGSTFEVALQADPSLRLTGKVREIAPAADDQTRTYRVRITLDQPRDAFRLGATITAFPTDLGRPDTLEIPRTAILKRDGATFVWLVDEAGTSVRSGAIEISDENAQVVRVADGLAPGDRVVVAGVHSLSEGQTVTLDGGAVK